jgi:hypothetical protein
MRGKRNKVGSGWIVATALVWWAVLILALIIPNGAVVFLVMAALPIVLVLSFISLVILIRGHVAPNTKDERYVHSPLAKVITALVVASIATSVYATIRSLWIYPWDLMTNKFVYENIATCAGFASIVFIFILSGLQRDIYWVIRRKDLRLDERQLKERQEVFETSYKLGTSLVLIAAYFFSTHVGNIQAIIAHNYNSVPGHLSWLAYDLVIALFALPLIVAVWKRKTATRPAPLRH